MENITTDWKDTVHSILDQELVLGVRRIFYIVTPSETSFKSLEDVPNFVALAVPYFFAFIFIESFLLILKNKSPFRVNDAISSVSAGIYQQVFKVFFVGLEMVPYLWVYENWRVLDLAWNNTSTWWLGLLGIDFMYYWFHRAAHEVNILWAGHQVHHSAEDYNLSTALRQSVFQTLTSWIFYVPLALAIPPSVMVTHQYFNLLYQFWIHTELVKSLGPLEWILNTPKHHRVHHGRNRFCIDKNYGGTLIIWDRLFGTFAEEEEQVVYGLVHSLSSWDANYIQWCHLQYIIKTAWNMEGLSNKLSVFLKGPGWEPGKPRTGLITDIPEIHAPQPKYDKNLPNILNIYIVVHFLMATAGFSELEKLKLQDPLILGSCCFFFLVTLTSIGFILEHKWFSPHFELFRCVIFLAADFLICSAATCHNIMYIPRSIFLFSASMWLLKFTLSSDDAKMKKL